MSKTHRDERYARDTIRICKDTMRKDAMEFGDPYIRVPTQQGLKIAECVAAYKAGDVDKVSCIDEREK